MFFRSDDLSFGNVFSRALLEKNITITEIVREKNIIAASKTCSNVNH